MRLLTVVLAALAAAAMLGRPRVGEHRLAAVRPVAGPARRDTPMRPVAFGVAGLAVAVLVGLPLGAVVGALVCLAGPRLVSRLEPRQVRAERRRLVADLPLCLDLLAACLAGGAAPGAAAAAVATAVAGPCGERLAAVAAALRVGTNPPDAWGRLSSGLPDDPLAPAARALARAAQGGAPVAGALGQLALEARAATRAVAEQAVRRAGVLVVAPLGLCFLPAFVLLGVMPVVLGLAAPLLAGA